MEKNDDDRSVKVVQLFAVATTVFVLVFLYMAKKLRDRKRVHGGDNCSDGSAVGATGTGSSSSSSSNNNNNVDGGGDSNHRDEDGSPPRLHKHQAVADVVELVIYPVKSCAGVSYDQLQLTKTGFWGDRLWMVVRPHKAADAEEASFSTTASKHTTLLRYKFLTQRECPRMALVQPKIESDFGGLNDAYMDISGYGDWIIVFVERKKIEPVIEILRGVKLVILDKLVARNPIVVFPSP